MNEEKTYYEKILVSSGEVPEDGIYDFTSHGQAEYINGGWRMFKPLHGQWINVYPEWYMKPVPSPKQEIKQLIEDYKRKIKLRSNMRGKDATEIVRLATKDSCYKTFVTELERVIR